MKKLFKQLFCRHEMLFKDSYRTGSYGCLPLVVQNYECTRCGKEESKEVFLNTWEDQREYKI